MVVKHQMPKQLGIGLITFRIDVPWVLLCQPVQNLVLLGQGRIIQSCHLYPRIVVTSQVHQCRFWGVGVSRHH
jgi:hypothetical protein